MSIRNNLKATASRFMHLSSLPRGPQAKKAGDKEETKEEKEAREKADKEKADDEARRKAAATKKKDDGENDDDDDEDEEEDEEEVKKAQGAGHGAAVAAAQRQERRRCAAIFSSEHAEGRIPLACELAFGTDMKASAAIRVLSASVADNHANPLAVALAEMPKHEIGGDAGKPGAETPDQRLVASAKAAAQPKK